MIETPYECADYDPDTDSCSGVSLMYSEEGIIYNTAWFALPNSNGFPWVFEALSEYEFLFGWGGRARGRAQGSGTSRVEPLSWVRNPQSRSRRRSRRALTRLRLVRATTRQDHASMWSSFAIATESWQTRPASGCSFSRSQKPCAPERYGRAVVRKFGTIPVHPRCQVKQHASQFMQCERS